MRKYKSSPLFLTIGILVFVAYFNSLKAPFIWDDVGLIVRNPLIQDWHNWSKVFTRDLYSSTLTGSNFYRPIQTLSLIWDYYFWGLNPIGYHLTNILLQVLVSFLAFLFVKSITRNIKTSFLSAVLFGISPLNTEAVTYISGRADLLMGFFLFSSIILFMKTKEDGRRINLTYLILSLLAFLFALLSKELSLVFPFAVLAYLIYFRKPQQRITASILKPVLPYYGMAVIYVIFRITFLNFSTLRPPALADYPLILRLSVIPKVLLVYLRLLFFPVGLHMSWAINRPITFTGFMVSFLFLAFFFTFSLYILLRSRLNKVFRFAFSWFLIFLAPQVGILPINAFLAEHFIYLSSLSFYLLLAYLLVKNLRDKLFIYCSVGIILFYGILTFSRNIDWQDPVVFYEKNIKYSPDSFQSYNNLGTEYEYRHKMYNRAELAYKRALEIKPDLIEARSNLANLYFKTGKFSDALNEYEMVKKTAPQIKLGEIENNIGCIYDAEGLYDKALESYDLALRFEPSLHFTHFNISKIFLQRGKLTQAAFEIVDSLPELKNYYGADDKRYIGVIKDLLNNGGLVSAFRFYNDLGVQFASKSMYQAALFAFERSIEAQPSFADAYFNLGLAYWNLGKRKEAILAMKNAIKINPNHMRAKGFLNQVAQDKKSF